MVYLKHDIVIEEQCIDKRLKKLINQVYRLLPTREEGGDWEKPLETILEEFGGMSRLFSTQVNFFSLVSKLEGLYKYTREEDFINFRRVIFECLSLINEIKEGYKDVR